MLVTINTDASFCPKTKLGAYAFWIVCNQARIKHSAIFKNKLKNETEAEAMCILNAFHVISKSKITGISKIILNSDAKYFMPFIQKRPQLLKQFNKLQTQLVLKYSLKRGWYDFRHVKAHVTTDGARNWVNDWCDTEAKKALKDHKKQLSL